MIGRDTFSALAPVLGPQQKKLATSPSCTIHGDQDDTKHVTFELLLHAAFVADELWSDMLEPARRWYGGCSSRANGDGGFRGSRWAASDFYAVHKTSTNKCYQYTRGSPVVYKVTLVITEVDFSSWSTPKGLFLGRAENDAENACEIMCTHSSTRVDNRITC